MGVTQASTRQIKDGGVNIDDLDITTTGKAVVTKIVAGTNVTISETGVDSGSGAVTINAGAGAVSIINTNTLVSGTLGAGSGSSATFSTFLGVNAGVNANVVSSVFVGAYAGNSATNASVSNFFGDDAGHGATDAASSNFFGSSSGYSASNAANSNFFGSSAGYNADNASNSIFIGQEAGNGDTVNNTGSADDFSILLGKDTDTGGFSNSIAIGGSATNTAPNQLMIGSSVRAINQVVINGSSPYLNFGATGGSGGYGFRDNAGTMQVKDSGGSWANFGGGGGGNSVTSTLDFGSSFTDKAELVVTGQSWVASTSEIIVQVKTPSGVDPDEIRLLNFKPVVSALVVGTGFTITLYSETEAKGTYDVMCIGV